MHQTPGHASRTSAVKRTRRLAMTTLAVSLLAAAVSLAAAPERPATRGGRPSVPSSAELARSTSAFLRAHDRGVRAMPPAPARGGRRSPFPGGRIVAYYGAPQLGETVVGRNTPARARMKLRDQARAYDVPGAGPVTPAFDLIAVIATSDRGPDRRYRTRQSDEVIQSYLDQARRLDGRLLLDIQPGRSSFRREVHAMRSWLLEPDVDLALDPEWNVGRRGIPGRTEGSVSARRLNRISRRLQRLVTKHDLPDKVLVVHQFRRGSVRHRNRVRRRENVAVTLNFDGIGGPAAKIAGYERLSSPALFSGFSLFYRLDRDLMRPPEVLALAPAPDFVLYQ